MSDVYISQLCEEIDSKISLVVKDLAVSLFLAGRMKN
jgi:hypothetical protein